MASVYSSEEYISVSEEYAFKLVPLPGQRLLDAAVQFLDIEGFW
jgi:hypothetical protein